MILYLSCNFQSLFEIAKRDCLVHDVLSGILLIIRCPKKFETYFTFSNVRDKVKKLNQIYYHNKVGN